MRCWRNTSSLRGRDSLDVGSRAFYVGDPLIAHNMGKVPRSPFPDLPDFSSSNLVYTSRMTVWARPLGNSRAGDLQRPGGCYGRAADAAGSLSEVLAGSRGSTYNTPYNVGRYLGTYPAIGLDRSGLARPRWLPSLSGLALSKALPGLDVKAGQIKGEKRGLKKGKGKKKLIA